MCTATTQLENEKKTELRGKKYELRKSEPILKLITTKHAAQSGNGEELVILLFFENT